MLGFWIIIAHLVGAYLVTSEYIQKRSASSTAYAVGSAILYIIPFVVFLPSSPLSLVAVLVFRFATVRFSLMDYVIWARNLMAPRNMRPDRAVKEGHIGLSNDSFNHILAMNIGSIAIHCVFMALAIIVL